MTTDEAMTDVYKRLHICQIALSTVTEETGKSIVQYRIQQVLKQIEGCIHMINDATAPTDTDCPHGLPQVFECVACKEETAIRTWLQHSEHVTHA